MARQLVRHWGGKPEASRVRLKRGDKIAWSLEKPGELRFEPTGPPQA